MQSDQLPSDNTLSEAERAERLQDIQDAIDDPTSDVDLLFEDNDSLPELLQDVMFMLAMLSERVDTMDQTLQRMQLDIRYCTQMIDRHDPT